MSSNQEISAQANEHRKAGNLKEAIELYEELWEGEEDKFTAGGLLHCYRKLKRYDKALEFAEVVLEKYPDFKWCRNECIWTSIIGKLFQLPEDTDTLTVIEVANTILDMEPEVTAHNMVVFKVAKVAKKNRDWEIMSEWLIKIDPEQLQEENEVKGNWMDKELWYYYRAVGLIATGNFSEGVELINQVKDKFRGKAKFFERLIAKASVAQENFTAGEEIYDRLTSKWNVDWWMLHEYAKVLLKNGKEDKALKLMFKAAVAPGPVANKVSLFRDLADVIRRKGKTKDALLHYQLVRLIREEQGWLVSDDLTGSIKRLTEQEAGITLPANTGEGINACKKIWFDNVDETDKPRPKPKTRNLKGKVKFGDPNKPFCFIETKDKEMFFCSKDDLPDGTRHGQLVKFDLKPSFDKKKNEKSYRAVKILFLK